MDKDFIVNGHAPFGSGEEPLIRIRRKPSDLRLNLAIKIGVIFLCSALFALVLISCLSYLTTAVDRFPQDGSYSLPHQVAKAAAVDPTFIEHYELFQQFIRDHDRKYDGFPELEMRFANFRNSLKKVAELQHLERLTNTEFGINEFADKSEDEIKQMLLPMDYYKKLRRIATFIKPQPKMDRLSENLTIPAHFDWRDHGVVTPSKSQHHCGSCWAFASVTTVETTYAIAHGTLRNLSQQELLDCNLENNACGGGDVDKAFRFIHDHGLMTSDQYPYVAHRQNSCALEEYSGPTTKIDLAYFINPDENSMIEWLLNFGPVNVGISVPPDMTPYKGGVYNPSAYDCKFKVLGLHALNIVGYGTSKDGEKYWIVKNSWGPKWGVEQGYVYFARGVNACGIEDEPVGLIV